MKIKEVIIVEGKCDVSAVKRAVNATVLSTGGFRIFSDEESMALIRALAAQRGVILLTDPDGAGFLIRNHLKGALGGKGVKHAYIPDMYGKERRKRAPSKEGKLGVEAMDPEAIRRALVNAGATVESGEGIARGEAPITKARLYLAGLSGRPDSAARRARLLHALNLPERMGASALAEALSILINDPESARIINQFIGDDHEI